ncbi:MAG: PLP-dependent transferase, partial [Acidimicrobiia bacterium]
IGYLLQPGDHVVLSNDAYGGTYRYFADVLGSQGVEWSVADLTDRHSLAATLRPSTRLVWVETPTNPLLRIVDLRWVVAAAHDAGVWVCVDNTFATPYLQRPLAFGADFVLHSTTKYVGGHSDVVGGCVVVNDRDLLERLRFLQNAAGPVPGPFDCYLVLRGLKTLALRMDRHCSNAGAVAEFLAGHRAVDTVIYPGHASHPHHELATRQMSGFGGMVSFIPAGGVEAARAVSERTNLFILAESLGGVESLVEVPALMTHTSVEGTALAVPQELVRLSVGIEHPDDLLADLEQALG